MKDFVLGSKIDESASFGPGSFFGCSGDCWNCPYLLDFKECGVL